VAEILLDGESVQFDGPIPPSLQELLGLIEHSLAAAGRVLARVAVDGRAVESTISDAEFAAARRIEVASLSMADAVARIAAGCGRRAAAVRTAAAQACQDVLREPWSEVAPKLVALGGGLGELLRELDSLRAVPPHAAQAQSFSAGLERWLDAVAARDAAAVCLSLESELLPRLEEIAALAEAAGKADAP